MDCGPPGSSVHGIFQSRLWFFLWLCMDVRVGLWRNLSTEELMLLNCGVGEDSWPRERWSFLFFLKFYFIFKLYIIVLVLPNIKMNLPQVYMCSPSWTLLPPPSPYHPSGSSQCTSPKHPVSCIEPGLATRFLHDILHVSMPFSQIFHLSLCNRVHKTVLYITVSFAVSYTGLLLASF